MLVLSDFLRHLKADGDRVTNVDRSQELQCLVQVNRAWPRKPSAQQSRDQRAGPHAMAYDAMQRGIGCVLCIQVGGVHVT